MEGKIQVHVRLTNYEPWYEVTNYGNPSDKDYAGTVNLTFELPTEIAATIHNHVADRVREAKAEPVKTVKAAAR